MKVVSTIGIEISEFEDTVIWSRDEKKGIPTTKVAYVALLEESSNLVSKWWCKQLWKGNLPLKIKFFLWLALENKFLTQENFQKRRNNC